MANLQDPSTVASEILAIRQASLSYFFQDQTRNYVSRVDLSPYVLKQAAGLLDARSLLKPVVKPGLFSQKSPLATGWLARPAPGEDGKSTKLPGSPGHAATNVIDRNGGLDPTGRTVDGNNAAGISKQTGTIG